MGNLTVSGLWIAECSVLKISLLSVEKDAVTLCQRHGFAIGTPKNQLKKFEQELLAKAWQTVHAGLEVKLCPSPDGTDEVFILCRSNARKEKERAMHNLFVKRIKQGLEKLQKSCANCRVKTINVAERRIGRLLEKNQRAASLFHIDVKQQNSMIDVHWRLNNTETDWASLSEGCYLLRTNIKDWTPEDLWKAYISTKGWLRHNSRKLKQHFVFRKMI